MQWLIPILLAALLALAPSATPAAVSGAGTGSLPFWINRIVLCELVVGVMTRAFGLDRERAAALLADLLRSRHVEVEDPGVMQPALYMFRTSSAEFADRLICVSNRLSGCERHRNLRSVGGRAG